MVKPTSHMYKGKAMIWRGSVCKSKTIPLLKYPNRICSQFVTPTKFHQLDVHVILPFGKTSTTEENSIANNMIDTVTS